MTDVTTKKSIDELVLDFSDEQVVSPTIPVAITIGEAGELHQYAMEDIKELLAKGLSENLINELAPRARFLQDKQSEWTAVYQSALTSTPEWETRIDEASRLQRELKYDFQFAYRNNPDILKRLQNILGGHTHTDLIQDMSDFPAFAKQYPEQLTAINFDTTKTVRAEQLSNELFDLLAKVDGAKKQYKPTRKNTSR